MHNVIGIFSSWLFPPSKKWWAFRISHVWLFIWPFQLIVKVVDLINDAPDAVRPTILVSATAVGYYGLHLAPTFLFFYSTIRDAYIILFFKLFVKYFQWLNYMSGIALVSNYRAHYDIHRELIFPLNRCYSFILQIMFLYDPLCYIWYENVHPKKFD
jgi:hypothetical protein